MTTTCRSDPVITDRAAFARWIAVHGAPDGVEYDRGDTHGGYEPPVPEEPEDLCACGEPLSRHDRDVCQVCRAQHYADDDDRMLR